MPIVVTVTKEEITAEEVQAVVLRLKKAVPVEQKMLGFLVGAANQGYPRLTVNLVNKVLTLSVLERQGDIGLWIAAAIAATLKIDLVGIDGQSLPANSSTVSRIWGRPFTEEGKDLAEKLGLILPQIKAAKVCVPF